MGCGCNKNASRSTRPAIVASSNPVIRTTSNANANPNATNAANVTPRLNQSVSGLSVNRREVDKIRQEAIRKSLGR